MRAYRVDPAKRAERVGYCQTLGDRLSEMLGLDFPATCVCELLRVGA